jgi:hypothetical protein
MSAEKLVSPRIQLYLAVGLLAAAMGCSGLDSATGTTADDTVQASEAAAAPTDASRKATHDSLKAIAAQERERIHQAREQHKEEFAAARQAWNAYRKAIAEAKKHKRDFTIEVLRCEPQEYAGDAQVIGPEGGTLHVGKHELKIPKGALDHEVVITGEAPVSELAEVELEPHGLTFDRPAQLKLNYDNCVVPMDLNLFIVYLNEAGTVLEVRPSTDKKGLSEVVGDLDHFSRYAVAW